MDFLYYFSIETVERKINKTYNETIQEINPLNILITDLFRSKTSLEKVSLLYAKNIYTIGNLKFYTEAELLKINGIDKYFVKQLKRKLNEFNIMFKMDNFDLNDDIL